MKRIFCITAMALSSIGAIAAETTPTLENQLQQLQQQLQQQQQQIEVLQQQLHNNANVAAEEVSRLVKSEMQNDIDSMISTSLAQSKDKAAMVRPSSGVIKDLQIRGRIQSQFGYTSVKNDDGKFDYSTFEMRRVRLGMRGTLFDDFRAQVEANMLPTSTNEFSLSTAFIEWRKHKPAYIKLGYDAPVFGFETNTSSAEIITVERSLISNTVVPGEMTGLSLSGTQGIFSYATGVYNDRANRNADRNDRYLVNLSAGVNLDGMINEASKLRLRADYLKSDDTGGSIGTKFDRDAMAISSHFALNGFDLSAEYIVGRDKTNGDTSGWYVMPSQYISDNLQLVARYEMAKADTLLAADANTGLRAPSRYMQRAIPGGPENRNQRGDAYKALYLGANYYMAKHQHKLMLGVEFSELENTAKGDMTAITCYTAWRMLF